MLKGKKKRELCENSITTRKSSHKKNLCDSPIYTRVQEATEQIQPCQMFSQAVTIQNTPVTDCTPIE